MDEINNSINSALDNVNWDNIFSSMFNNPTPPTYTNPATGLQPNLEVPSYTNVTNNALAIPSIPNLTQYLDQIQGANTSRLAQNAPYKEDYYNTYKTIADMTANQTQVNKDIKDYIAEQYGNYGKINSQANEAVLGALTGRNTQLNTMSNAFANTDRTINPAILAAADVALRPQQQAALDLAATRDVLMQTPAEMVKTGAEIYNDQIKAQQVKAEAAKELITMNNNDFSILAEIIGKYPALKQTEFGMGLQARNQVIGENQAQNTIASQTFADETAQREQRIQDNLYANQMTQQEYENRLTAKQNQLTGLEGLVNLKQTLREITGDPASLYLASSTTNPIEVQTASDGGRIITKDSLTPMIRLTLADSEDVKDLAKAKEAQVLLDKTKAIQDVLSAKEYYQMTDAEKVDVRNYLTDSKAYLTKYGKSQVYEQLNPYMNQDYLTRAKLFGATAKGLKQEDLAKAGDPYQKSAASLEKQKQEATTTAEKTALYQAQSSMAEFKDKSKPFFDVIENANKIANTEFLNKSDKKEFKDEDGTILRTKDGETMPEGLKWIEKRTAELADVGILNKNLGVLDLPVPASNNQINLVIPKVVDFLLQHEDLAIKRMGMPKEIFDKSVSDEDAKKKMEEALRDELKENEGRNVVYFPIDLRNVNQASEMGELVAIKGLFDLLEPLYKGQIEIT